MTALTAAKQTKHDATDCVSLGLTVSLEGDRGYMRERPEEKTGRSLLTSDARRAQGPHQS